jgi:hypothetical protein
VTYVEIDAPHGHDAFLLDNRHYHELVAAYFDNVAGEIGKLIATPAIPPKPSTAAISATTRNVMAQLNMTVLR